MKKRKLIFLLIILTGLVSFLNNCRKDEVTEEQIRKTTINKLNDEISADSLERTVTWMQSMVTRFALSGNHRNVAIQIQTRFKKNGFSDAKIDSFLINKIYQNINYQQWQYNIIATLRGNAYPDSVCIIGAHYDDNLKTGDPFSIIPGANDNAGGIAAALEIARVMKKNSYSPKNTIEFIAFGAEEIGLFGSSAYAVQSVQKSKKIKFMLNNDMIAYQPSDDHLSWAVNIIDYDNSHNLRIMAEKSCQDFTVLHYINDNTYNKQSDSYPFFTNGYKALFFFSTFIDPNYHTLLDIVENCNFDYCREIVKLSCALLVNNN
jgi:bacterial leucyl aminopeptidase